MCQAEFAGNYFQLLAPPARAWEEKPTGPTLEDYLIILGNRPMNADESALPPTKPPPDNFPSVEPPTAGFILQLFLIPLLIVSIVVAVWMMFGWLAHAGQSNPETVLRDLKRMGSNSFQRAHELASLLQEQGERGDTLRNDPKLAGEVGDLLLVDLKSFPREITESQGKLRMYLCRALALFQCEEAIPPLVAVLQHTGEGEGASSSQPALPARAENDPHQKQALPSQAFNVQVRIGAAESLAILADKMGPQILQQRPDVVPALLEATSPTESQLNSDQATAEELAKHSAERMKSGYRPHQELKAVATFALGVIRGDAATKRLNFLLRDAYHTTRYNAATGLARQGDERALETLLEMLDPANKAPLDNEWHPKEKEQALVNTLRAGMQAALRLAETNPQADVSQLRTAIENLSKDPLSALTNSGSRRMINLHATETLRILEQSARNNK